MFTPSAPSASAAAMARPPQTPPEAITGIFTACTVAGIITMPGTSHSPRWPAASKLSIEITSTPMRSADTACRTAVHLWITVMPASLNAWITGRGLLPAVSTILTPLATMASTQSS
ncbi:hypothetical protein D3C81_1294050 [compost metagenome]